MTYRFEQRYIKRAQKGYQERSFDIGDKILNVLQTFKFGVVYPKCERD